MIDKGPTGREPGHPRSEPEIIPPSGRRPEPDARITIRTGNGEGFQRIYIARPGPFSVILALAVIGLVAAVVLLLLVGFVVIWVPVVIVLVLAALLSGTIRHWWRRLQAAWTRRA
jgi:hypothetical protein